MFRDGDFYRSHLQLKDLIVIAKMCVKMRIDTQAVHEQTLRTTTMQLDPYYNQSDQCPKAFPPKTSFSTPAYISSRTLEVESCPEAFPKSDPLLLGGSSFDNPR